MDPLDSAVVTVGTVSAGTAFNIIPQDATIGGTIRTFKQEITERIHSRFLRIIESTAQAMGCQAEIEIKRITYPVINDPDLTGILSEVVKQMDPDARIDSAFQTMGSEDFSFMMQDIPGCFMMVGSANADKRTGLRPSPSEVQF